MVMASGSFTFSFSTHSYVRPKMHQLLPWKEIILSHRPSVLSNRSRGTRAPASWIPSCYVCTRMERASTPFALYAV
jgi:hypothetical protein